MSIPLRPTLPIDTTDARTIARRAALFALPAGALYPLAFSPVEVAPLALLALAVLFWLWRGASAREAAWQGYLFGLGQFGVGASWIIVSMARYSEVGWAVALLMTVLFIAILALYPALVGYLVARLRQRLPDAMVLLLLIPALWTATEWLRSWFLGGFPWLQAGYSQLDWPLAGLAPALGVYGVSWALALSAALLAWLWYLRRKLWLGALVLAALWGGAWGLGRIAWTAPAGPPLQVSLIQGNIAQDMKWLPEQVMPSIALYVELTRRHWDSQLIVWPETAMPLFYDEAEPLLDQLEEEARGHGADLLFGVPVYEAGGGNYYNAVASLGSARGFYYKRHLVPFGEFFPLRAVLGRAFDFFNFPLSDFSAGAAVQAPLSAAGQAVAASVCYEAAFGEEMIMALPRATLLVNVSNDAWFGDSLAPAQHLQMARMRALETGRWMMRATNTGISALIDDRGTVRQHGPQFRAAVVTGQVQPRGGATPYVRWGNYPVLVLLGVSLMSAWWLGRRFPGLSRA